MTYALQLKYYNKNANVIVVEGSCHVKISTLI